MVNLHFYGEQIHLELLRSLTEDLMDSESNLLLSCPCTVVVEQQFLTDLVHKQLHASARNAYSGVAVPGEIHPYTHQKHDL